MKKERCPFCYELIVECVCYWDKCAICGARYSNFDPDEEHQIFEYRGFLACSKCHDELIKKVDDKRQQVQEVVEHSTRSQLDGQWDNGGYKTMKTDPHTGRPMGKVKEPQILKDYENGVL